jgi:glucosyl-dolichyl phosphate glucuronosyltransferase
MKISVVVCTYNRCEKLATTLQSIAESKMQDSDEWEILVVDNNSKDRTHELIDDFSRRYPNRFRYIFEPRQGKSFALNTAISAARGEALAFVDDDVMVVPEWLQNLIEPLRGGRWAGVGGRILPAEKVAFPRWMRFEGDDGLGGVIAAYFDEGDEPLVLHRPPYGANMAVRKEMFERFGGYRLDIGPSPNKLVPRPGEDTEFGRRLMRAGQLFVYEPLAVVYHPVQTERIRKDYILGWWFDYGRGELRERGNGEPILGIPRHYVRVPRNLLFHLPKLAIRWLLTLNPRRRFWNKCQVWSNAGRIAESFQLYREHKELQLSQETQELKSSAGALANDSRSEALHEEGTNL